MKKSQLKTLIKEALLEGGYSNFYPGGKTPGLSSDVLNKILLRIAQGKRTEDEPYEGDPTKGNKILDTADQENVDRILRGEEPQYGDEENDDEIERMQELAGLKNEIKINNPTEIKTIKQFVNRFNQLFSKYVEPLDIISLREEIKERGEGETYMLSLDKIDFNITSDELENIFSQNFSKCGISLAEIEDEDDYFIFYIDPIEF